MFLKNCWYMGGWDHEVMDGKLLERRILDQPVVFYRGESGQIVALDNRCCHRGAKLSQGRIEGDCVRCMYHGLKFDPTGKCVQIPGQDRIPPQLGVKSYPRRREAALMWIWMGDPALADPSDILDIPYLEDPKWKGIPAYLHYYRQLSADRRQFERLQPPRLRPYEHARRIGGICLRDQAGTRSIGCLTVSTSSAGTRTAIRRRTCARSSRTRPTRSIAATSPEC